MDPEVKIIAASGMMHDQRETSASEAGALAFLWKPYTADTILLAISKALLQGSASAIPKSRVGEQATVEVT
jgi:CheY-like chemotaxis protein